MFRAIVGALTPGVALDAGVRNRSARRDPLVELGWDVIGVDATDAMLDRRPRQGARRDVPLGAARGVARRRRGSVDLVVCGLALTHVEDLAPVYAEFSRVLRAGGRVVTTDMNPTMNLAGGGAVFPTSDEPPDFAGGTMTLHYVPNLVHHVSEYVAAIVAAGLQVTGVSRAAGRRVVGHAASRRSARSRTRPARPSSACPTC